MPRQRRWHRKNTKRGRALVTFAESGRRFGRLTTMRVVEHKGRNHVLCRCDCGAERPYTKFDLEAGKVLSCGCLIAEKAHESKNLAHGHAAPRNGGRTSTYIIWTNMLQRCENTNDGGYARYGGRGIKVCERWHRFENFLADMGERPSGLTIDRIDNDGDYTPENCRWASPREQANNKRSCRILEHAGLRMTMVMWARHLGLDYDSLRGRIYRGASFARAIKETPHARGVTSIAV